MAQIREKDKQVLTRLLPENPSKERRQQVRSLQLRLRYPQLSAISLIIFTILVYGELYFIQHVGGTIVQLKSLCSGEKLMFTPDSIIELLGTDAWRFVFTYLAFPVAGWLADAKYGRLKVINMSVWFMWWGLLIMVVSLLLVVPSSLLPIHNQHQCNGSLAADIVLPLCTIFLLISFILIGIGAGGFLPNILPFIIDQLPEASSSLLSSYVRWYSWTLFVGYLIGLVHTSYIKVNNPPPPVLPAIGLFAVHSIVVIGNIFCQSLFIQSQGYDDPYKTVLRVVHFACKHKTPIKRSSLTYCERGLPSRFDLAKTKYGGPYTNEAVENVKTFFRILLVLLSLGGFFFVSSGPYIQLPAFLKHYDNLDSDSLTPWETVIAFTNPIVGVILLPVINIIVRFASYKFEYLVHKPFLWIGIGFILMSLCNGSLTIISVLNYALQANATQLNHTCFLYFYGEDTDTSVQNIMAYVVMPSLFYSLANVLVLTSSLYFICCQAPSSMRGMLIGLFQLGVGCFTALEDLFSAAFAKAPNCSIWFWLFLTIVSIASVPVYAIIAKKYRKREREEIINYRAMIESVIERDIRFDEDIERQFGSISNKSSKQDSVKTPSYTNQDT